MTLYDLDRNDTVKTALFLGGLALAGFALARFIKASREEELYAPAIQRPRETARY
ncbi:hypothetical protein RM543_13390 [Roseicyclus sp. F158]|uniref:Uncharacterized protein n=1 Tax=Tropicimonas omnivorans TaxID=3075590 RepID=A0ABU3DIY1_9RHOB|nr:MULTISPECIES: hypothetical protein [Roseobacteraceae]MDT0683681.1 hypothetical protein [Roseicyclus sp. F158]